MSRTKDLTGQRFTRLIVIERAESSKSGLAMWKCKCDCGNECVVSGSNLRKGHSKSCGCLKKDKIKERWEDEEYKNKMRQLRTDMNKEIWEDKNKRQQLENKLKDAWDDEERKERASQKTKEMWKDEEYRNSLSGENHRWYNHELTEEERLEGRKRDRCYGYNKWASEVKECSNYTCDCCSYKGSKNDGFMCSHHLESYDKNKELRIDITNGVCLCEHCHEEFHKVYGYGNNTKEQYIEFKENKNKGEM